MFDWLLDKLLVSSLGKQVAASVLVRSTGMHQCDLKLVSAMVFIDACRGVSGYVRGSWVANAAEFGNGVLLHCDRGLGNKSVHTRKIRKWHPEHSQSIMPLSRLTSSF